MFSAKLKKIFDRTIDVVFAVILAFIIIGIAIGTVQLFVTTWSLLSFKGITGHYIDIIADVLTLYVLVELSRSLVDYFDSHKLKLVYIIDAAIVFILREILIGLFKHQIKPEMLYAFSVIILVLGVLRFGSILVQQRERKMEAEIEIASK